ncbi:serine/threonine-protein kinase [Paraliomyxa miuraensis]|uniref:serine/threonine-protein kinase n=1 Tax=Paraliomyxa miuraensis TaxID=376150 RepID=UPI00225B8BCD|nr:serine/threonine-protein kinase [Paraliomyxa miuraensis]MCX4244543.1 serine/threonine-protein kinase [Paraliomyxa miuraensis]
MAVDDHPSEAPGVVMAARKAKLRASLFGEAPAAPRFGRYVILGTLGRGGMGTVLEAFDPTLDRRVALKLLHRDLAKHDTQRLVREAQALARLSHPNVVQVYEVGELGGQTFVAMELVPGKTLHAWATREPRPGWRACVEVYLQAGAGLAAAHAKGLVHRDFKPSNAIIDDEGHVRVLDFGLARRTDDSESGETSTDQPLAPERTEDTALDLRITATGAVLGTPAYMSPEQRRGRRVDARSDQFSFCVALYEAIHGERPHHQAQADDGRRRPLAIDPPPSGGAVPAKLRRALLRGLCSDPSMRWPSMPLLLEELRRQVVPRARARLVVGLALGLALASTAVGLGATYHAMEVGARCAGAADQLAGIWDDARKQALEQAMLGTGVPYAGDAWTRVEARLDAYSAAWEAKHEAVCEATRVREEQTEDVMSLRMGCLSSRRIALRAVVGVLEAADAGRVGKAMDLVDGLPSLTSCDDVEALEQRRADLPPPRDPRVATAVDEALARLAEADALAQAGDAAGSEAVADAVVTKADALGYGPLRADALRWRGRARKDGGDFVRAEQDLEQAYLLALEHRHDEVALAATTSLIVVVGDEQARFDEGQRWGRVAMALSRRPGGAALPESNVLVNLGVILVRHGEPRRALELYERALAIKEANHTPRHRDIALLLHQIGIVLDDLGRPDEALDHLRRALEIRREALGDEHPEIANSLDTIGVVIATQGHVTEGLQYFRQALATREEALGPDHPDVATSLNNIGVALTDLGRPVEALAAFERALPIERAALGPDHPDVGTLLLSMAELALHEGDHPTARAKAERAVEIHASAGSTPVVLAQARFVLARALWEDPASRARAQALATQARDACIEYGEGARTLLAQVDDWLEMHPAG